MTPEEILTVICQNCQKTQNFLLIHPCFNNSSYLCMQNLKLMFYKQIEHKRNEWYDSADCTVNNERFIPRKRCAIDGRVWWCVYDLKRNTFSTYTCHGKYTTRKRCQLAIDYSIVNIKLF